MFKKLSGIGWLQFGKEPEMLLDISKSQTPKLQMLGSISQVRKEPQKKFRFTRQFIAMEIQRSHGFKTPFQISRQLQV